MGLTTERMSTRPGHHSPSRWAQERGEDIRVVARTLARLLDAETRHERWRGRRGNRGRPRRWRPRGGPHWSDSLPPRRFQGPQEPRRWRPYFHDDRRWGRNYQFVPREQSLRDWRTCVVPRRGPPVAAIKAPHWYEQGSWEERRPRGNDPRCRLRGGP